MKIKKKAKSKKFVRIACPRCNKECITFGKASIKLKCQRCNKLLVKTTGGKTKINAPVREILWR